MPETESTSLSRLFQNFVRSPDDVVGLVAFGIYQAAEIEFARAAPLAHDARPPLPMEGLLDTFRAVAIAQIEGLYRPRARNLIDQFVLRSAGGRKPALSTDGLSQVEKLVADGQLDGAFDLFVHLLDGQPQVMEVLRGLMVIQSGFKSAARDRNLNLISMEEFYRASSRAADGLLRLVAEVKAARRL